LWDAGYPARIKHYYDMKIYSWKNTQFSQFNESDTLLLVSGVHFGNHSNTGEIAVFNLEVISENCQLLYFVIFFADFYSQIEIGFRHSMPDVK